MLPPNAPNYSSSDNEQTIFMFDFIQFYFKTSFWLLDVQDNIFLSQSYTLQDLN